MASTIYSYNLTGGRVFPVAFEYLARRFVKITLVGSTRLELQLNVDYRFISKTEIETTVVWAPGEYQTIEVRRVTSATDRLVNFTDGSILRSQDLNISQIQAIHIAEEGRDVAENSLQSNGIRWDALGFPISNLGEPQAPTDAATRNYVDDKIMSNLATSLRVLDGTIPALPNSSQRAGKIVGFDATGNPVMIIPAAGSGTELGIALADPNRGSKLVGHERTAISTAVDGTISKALSALRVDIWEFSHLVTDRPDPNNFETWNWTVAFEAARITVGALGGGTVTLGYGGVYTLDWAQIDRNHMIDGQGVWNAELKQRSGANRDFIKSENFDELKGSGLNVNDPRVPSWFGLKDLRVNGNRLRPNNPTGNTVGMPVSFFGPSQFLMGTVMVYEGAGGGIYTEDSTNAAGSSWRAQEEGKFGNVILRGNGGMAGWHCRGPHNNDMNSLITGFNDGWNFYSEEAGNYGGSFDRIGMLHSYAGGRGVEPNADTGIYIGGIARVDNMVVDGDNAVLQSNEIQIGKLRAYNIGGQMNGIIINGDNIHISDLNAQMWGLSVNRTALIVNGNNAVVKGSMIANNPNNNGARIIGSGHEIELTIRNFSGPDNFGLTLAAIDSTVNAKIRNCGKAFVYESGGDNQVTLSIATQGAQVPVSGITPKSTDRFNIHSRGSRIGKMKARLVSDMLAMDITTYTIVTYKHGLLYTPPREAVVPAWVVSAPDSSLYDTAIIRVVETTDTDVVIGYKLGTAAPAGTKARISVNIDLT